MKKTYLLDTSFLIDLADEAATKTKGPATRTLAKIGTASTYITPITEAELLEGAEDILAAQKVISGYRRMTIGSASALRCALNQSRAPQRMGENDAWQAALAVTGGHVLVGHDKAFERRPWLEYLDHAEA